jgi:filamentous hemagglutinin family protein
MNVCLTLSHFGAIALCASFPSLAVLLRSTERFAIAIASFTSFLFAFTLSVQAQIVPDSTLPTPSVVTPNGSTLTITGGKQVGTNVFHSFGQFSVLTGQTAYFNNDLSVQNILTRVTGGNISTIDGLIQANGTANLFFINPSGIVFGPNAQLNIGGSFIASTANSIKLADGNEFSATNPQAPPLLTINVPIGLQFGSNPRSIINQSTALAPPNLPTLPSTVPISNNVGLAVQPGQTLALIGGDVLLNGGNLTANTGQIFLGSVASAGMVRFTPTPFGLSLNYDNIQNFGNISLSGGSLINTSGLGGGKVEIRGGNVSLNGGRIYALTLGNIDGRGIDINAQTFRAEGGTQISTLTRGNGAGGAINIRATDSVELNGIGVDPYRLFVGKYLLSGSANPFDPQVLLITGTSSMGNAGNIAIDTEKLLIDNGAVLASTTFSTGNAGNMTIRARDFELVGSVINSGTFAGSTGAGGDINFEGERLTVSDGAALISISRDRGASGNINIKASESVEVLRTPDGSPVATLIGSTAGGVNGQAGDINIETKRLRLSEGSGISLSSGSVIGNQPLNTTGGPGGNLTIRATESVTVEGISGVLANGSRGPSFISADANAANRGGNMNISTPVLTLRDGGVITTASLGRGDAGSITIDAGRVEVIGNGGQGEFNSQIQTSVGIASRVINPNATANGGSLNLNVGQLILRNGGTLNLQALGTGQAGNINVVADAIALDNQSSIDGRTASGGGANINLQASEIRLRRGSRISTDAGNANGGNITINTDTLVAVPKENSDITANAQQGSGGRIRITAQGIFGTEFRDRLTPESDITATSDLGPEFNGTVQIDIRGIDPNRGLAELPETLADSSNQIAQTCSSQARNNSFVVTGRGGLPPTPQEALNSAPGWIDWRVSAGKGGVPVPALGDEETRGREEFSTEQSTIQNRSTELRQAQLPRSRRSPKSKIQNPLVEATGWVRDADGTVQLVANPSAEVSSNSYYPQKCQANHSSSSR